MLERDYLDSVLAALFTAVNGSLHAHVPLESVGRKMQVNRGSREFKHIPKAMRILVSEGCASRHPTSGGMTYHLTRKGHERIRQTSE